MQIGTVRTVYFKRAAKAERGSLFALSLPGLESAGNGDPRKKSSNLCVDTAVGRLVRQMRVSCAFVIEVKSTPTREELLGSEMRQLLAKGASRYAVLMLATFLENASMPICRCRRQSGRRCSTTGAVPVMSQAADEMRSTLLYMLAKWRHRQHIRLAFWLSTL